VPFEPTRTLLSADRIDLPTSADGDQSRLFVSARVNGAGPFQFLVDTGTDGLVLAPEVAAAGGLRRNVLRTVSVMGAGGRKVRMATARVEQWESGGLTLQRFDALILPDQPAGKPTHREYAGILGIKALRGVVLEMDFSQRQVTVVRPETAQYPLHTAIPYQGDTPVVALNVAGNPLDVLIDTGDNGILRLPLDKVPLLSPPLKAGRTAVSVDGHGAIETSQLAGQMRLGPVTWVNPPVSASPSDAAIGAAALSEGKLVVDQLRRKVYLIGKEQTRSWLELEWTTGSGLVFNIRHTGLRVVAVKPGSPAAAAGLRPDDLIATINGRKSVDYVRGGTTESTRDRLQELGVVRDGETTKVKMELSAQE
jgi:hypothetical protein